MLCIGVACALVLSAFAGIVYGAYIPKRYRPVIESAAAEFSLEEELLFAVIRAESNFDPTAVSAAGAVGLMQLMPATARFASLQMKEPLDARVPMDNVRMGAWYLQYLARKFSSIELLLAAYNAGEGVVARWIQDGAFDRNEQILTFPYKETTNYVRRVKNFYKFYKLFYF